MAIVRAVKTGVWSDPTTWNTGALPTSADDVYSNTFTVTIDISPTVLSISNASTTGVTAGGTFVPNNGITLTCTATIGVSGGSVSTPCFDSSLTSGQSCLVTANCVNGTATNAQAIRNNGTGTVNIVGNATCPNQNVHCIVNNSSGVINFTGNCTGGIGAATETNGVRNNSSGIVNITGNCTGGTAGGAISSGAYNASSGTLNITGTCTGSGWSGSWNHSTGLMTVSGTIQASNSSAGVSAPNISGTTVLTGPFLTSNNGVNPVYAVRWFWANSNLTPTYYEIRTQNLATIRPLYTADFVGGNPAVSNVRLGTVYGPSNELTGTMAVPPASSVTFGVPVDNTTGTAAISAADFWNQSISGITTSGSIGERLKNAATVNTVSKQISDAFSGPYT